MKIIAVMPAYEEAPRISQAITAVLRYVPTVVVLDDGSRDDTAGIARTAGAIVLRHAVNRGQGAALKTGTMAALHLGADIIVHIDADGQHDPSFIPALLEPIKTGQMDVVFGSRFLGVEVLGMPWSRRVLHWLIKRFNAFALGIPQTVSDPQSGLRAFTAEAARAIQFRQDRMAHCSEILRLVTRSHFRWQEIGTRVIYTDHSLRKGQKSSDALKIVWQLFLGVFHEN